MEATRSASMSIRTASTLVSGYQGLYPVLRIYARLGVMMVISGARVMTSRSSAWVEITGTTRSGPIAGCVVS